jgi:hypothetical protein
MENTQPIGLADGGGADPRELIEDEAAVPDRGRAAKQRQHHAGEHRLDQEEQERAKQRGVRIEDAHGGRTKVRQPPQPPPPLHRRTNDERLMTTTNDQRLMTADHRPTTTVLSSRPAAGNPGRDRRPA